MWKLHGSCNFKPTGFAVSNAAQINVNVAQFGVGMGFEIMQPSDVTPWCMSDNALYPCMAMFAHGKRLAVTPTPIENAQNNWKARVLDSDRILLLGVNPHVEDNHIWQPLSDTAAEIGFVGNETNFQAWVDDYRGGRPSVFLGSRWSTSENDVVEFLIE